MNIDQMPAGREMDYLVKWHLFTINKEMGFKYWRENTQLPVLHYSTDIAAAWEVVEKLRITVTPDIGHGWMAAWCNASGYGETSWVGLTNYKKWSKADTAPLAICRAALKALGVE